MKIYFQRLADHIETGFPNLARESENALVVDAPDQN